MTGDRCDYCCSLVLPGLMCGCAADETIRALRAENARLREALERIASFPVLLKSLVQSDRAIIHGLKDIAREALEEK